MTEFFTPEMLLTFTGQVLFVTTATQVIKKYIGGIDPKWISLALAVAVAGAAQLVILGDFSAQGLALAGANVFSVLSASVLGYEAVVKPVVTGIAAEKMHEEFEHSERGK